MAAFRGVFGRCGSCETFGSTSVSSSMASPSAVLSPPGSGADEPHSDRRPTAVPLTGCSGTRPSHWVEAGRSGHEGDATDGPNPDGEFTWSGWRSAQDRGSHDRQVDPAGPPRVVEDLLPGNDQFG